MLVYTRMTINESSKPCEQRRITFKDDGQRVQLTRPELLAPHLHVQAATNYIPITVQALLTPTYCRYQFTDPKPRLLQLNPKALERNEPRLSGPRPTQYQ